MGLRSRGHLRLLRESIAAFGSCGFRPQGFVVRVSGPGFEISRPGISICTVVIPSVVQHPILGALIVAPVPAGGRFSEKNKGGWKTQERAKHATKPLPKNGPGPPPPPHL